MPGQRKDYILDQIELLRQFVARLTGANDGGGLEQALQLSLHLQEKLFAMPPAEFLREPVDRQLERLRHGESPADGAAKCLTYARLLEQTARLYGFRGREDLADGARQLALHVALQVALAGPTVAPEAGALVKELLAMMPPGGLHAPVRELLDAFVARAD